MLQYHIKSNKINTKNVTFENGWWKKWRNGNRCWKYLEASPLMKTWATLTRLPRVAAGDDIYRYGTLSYFFLYRTSSYLKKMHENLHSHISTRYVLVTCEESVPRLIPWLLAWSALFHYLHQAYCQLDPPSSTSQIIHMCYLGPHFTDHTYYYTMRMITTKCTVIEHNIDKLQIIKIHL